MKKKLCIITLSFIVICHLFALNALADNWRLFIKAMGQGQQPSNVAIGVEDCDPCIWKAAPLMPEYAARIKILGQYGEELKLPSNAIEEWNLEVTVGVSEELPLPGDPNDPNQPFPVGDSGSVADASDSNFFPVLSWDPNEIGQSKFIELRLGDANGPVLVSDMKTTKTYQTTEGDASVTGNYDEPNSRARMRYTVTFKSGDKQEFPLCKGWNLISFQINHCYYQGTSPSVFIPEGVEMKPIANLAGWLSNDANSPLRDEADPNKAGNWQRITSFDKGGAHILDKDLPPSVNTLNYLSAGYGYWIKMNARGKLMLEGQFIPGDTLLELRNGWNLIGYIPHDTCYADIAQGSVCPYTSTSGVYLPEEGIAYCFETPLTSFVFTSIQGQYRRITSFDCCAGAMIYDTQLPPSVNTLHYIGPKYGYWIKIEDSGTTQLVFPENCTGI